MNQQQTATASFNLIVLIFTHLRQRREEKQMMWEMELVKIQKEAVFDS